MRVTFLGTGAGTSTPQRAGTSILVHTGEQGLLLDCGNRAHDRLVDLGIEPDVIDRIFISHLHPDHVLGLSDFISTMAFPNDHLPAEIVGPPGTARYAESAVTTASLVTGRPRQEYGAPLDVPVTEVDGGDVSEYSGGLLVRTEEVPHAANLVCQARRFEAGGKTLAFSGDTRAVSEIMVPLAEGADMLIHEAWSVSGLERWTQNSAPRTALAIRRAYDATHARIEGVARMAAEARVRTLVLTHLNPGERAEELIDITRAHFAGEIIIATDRLTIAV